VLKGSISKQAFVPVNNMFDPIRRTERGQKNSVASPSRKDVGNAEGCEKPCRNLIVPVCRKV